MKSSSVSFLSAILSSFLIFVLLILLSILTSIRFYDSEIRNLDNQEVLSDYLKKEFNISAVVEEFDYKRNFNNWNLSASNLIFKSDYLNFAIEDLNLSLFFLEYLIQANKQNVSQFYLKNAVFNVNHEAILHHMGEKDEEPKNDDGFTSDFSDFFSLKNIFFLLWGKKSIIDILHDEVTLDLNNIQIQSSNESFIDIEHAKYTKNNQEQGLISLAVKDIRYLDKNYRGILIDMKQVASNTSLEKLSIWNISGEIDSMELQIDDNINAPTNVKLNGKATIKPSISSYHFQGEIEGKTKNNHLYHSLLDIGYSIAKKHQTIRSKLTNFQIDKRFIENVEVFTNLTAQTIETSISTLNLQILPIVIPDISEQYKVKSMEGNIQKLDFHYRYDTGIFDEMLLLIPKLSVEIDSLSISKINDITLSYLHSSQQKTINGAIPTVQISLLEGNNIVIDNVAFSIDLVGDLKNIEAIKITTSTIEVENNIFHVNGSYRLKKSPKKNLELQIALNNSTVSNIRTLISKITDDEVIIDWLNNLVSGEVNQMVFNYEDKLDFIDELGGENSKIEATLKSDHLTLIPYKDWPILKINNINITYENSLLSMQAQDAIAIRSQAKIIKPHLIVNFNKGESIVSLKGTLSTKNKEAINLVRFSPIPQLLELEEIFNQLNIEGMLNGDIDIEIPLVEEQEKTIVNIDIALNFKDATIEYQDWHIQRTQGALYIKNDGTYTSTITGTLSDHFPITLKILPNKSAKEQQKAVYSIHIPKVEQFVDFSSGTASFGGEVTFPNQVKDVLKFTILSDLDDISLNLPSIFKKKKGDVKKLAAIVTQQNNTLNVDLAYDVHQIKAVYDWDKNTISPFYINVGNIAKKYTPHKQKGYVGINIPYIDLDEWLELSKYFNDMSAESTSTSTLPIPEIPLPEVFFASELILWNNTTLNNSQLSIKKNSSNSLIVDLQSQEVELNIQYIKNEKLDIEINKFKLPLNFNSEDSSTTKIAEETPPKKTEKYDPEQCSKIDYTGLSIPRISIAAANIELNNSSPATVIATGSLKDNTLKFEHFNFDNKHAQINIQDFIHNSSQTSVNIDMQITSISQLLSILGIKNSEYHAHDIIADGKFVWRDAPWCIAQNNLQTHIKAQTSYGAANGLEPGIGQLLAILNLKIWLKRFGESEAIRQRKDELEKQGMVFDKTEFEANINNGFINIKDFRIDSPIAVVKVKGNVDTLSQDYDLTARVKPEIIPAVVTLTTLFSGPLGGLTALISSEFLRLFNLDNYLLSYSFDLKGNLNEIEDIE